MNALEYLKQHTRIVADTGDIAEIRHWRPEEATTNPSLLLKAFSDPQQCEKWINAAYQRAQTLETPPSLSLILNACSICVAESLLTYLSGRISIEVDAHFSFNTQATINIAQQLVRLAQQTSLGTNRLLIKIAATWEGIQAIHALETQGIKCNGTLIFNETQALACAQAGATLISPFVGRIYDWYQAHNLLSADKEDPGVSSVKCIFNNLKSQSYSTEIMGASFRNTQQILALTGCDRLTIAPKFLQQLSEMPEPKANPLPSPKRKQKQPFINEALFRWCMNQDAMATEKLAEGIRIFSLATEQLLTLVQLHLDKKQQTYIH